MTLQIKRLVLISLNLTVITLGISCKYFITKKDNKLHFDAIDFTKAKGVSVMKNADEYPYVIIDTISASKRLLNYVLHKRDTFKVLFTFSSIDSIWTSNEVYNADTGWALKVSKFYPQKTIKLHYELDETKAVKAKLTLSMVEIEKGLESKRFIILGPKESVVGMFDSLYLAEPLSSITSSEMKFGKEYIKTLTKTKHYHESKATFIYADSTFYRTGGRSLNWWKTFGRFQISIYNDK